jgi:hypothetical protein
MSRFPDAFRPPAFACRTILRPPRSWAFLTVGLPGRIRSRTPTGLSRSARSRPDRGGCSLYPEAAVFPRLAPSHQPPLADSHGQPCPRSHVPSPGVSMTRHQREFARAHPSGLPLACGARTERAPLGVFPDASNPAVTSDARQGGDRSTNTDPELRCRQHRRPSNQRAHSNRATSCRTEELEALRSPVQVHDAGLGRVQLQPQRCQHRHHQLPRLAGAVLGGAQRDKASRRGDSHPPALTAAWPWSRASRGSESTVEAVVRAGPSRAALLEHEGD